MESTLSGTMHMAGNERTDGRCLMCPQYLTHFTPTNATGAEKRLTDSPPPPSWASEVVMFASHDSQESRSGHHHHQFHSPLRECPPPFPVKARLVFCRLLLRAIPRGRPINGLRGAPSQRLDMITPRRRLVRHRRSRHHRAPSFGISPHEHPNIRSR
ncbi:hypothetical protein LX36DRAFT_466443 [Colletotrichum falcatum]|nr:hypothetical protein LX36DRAFT_466443 [Colletotrichum falcatum]